VALYRLLEQVAPERILSPIAVDPERGWMVLPDGGTTLGERLDEVDLVEAMVTVLPEYGQLQRDLAPHLDDLLAFGMGDMRAAVMPRRFEEALETVGRHVEGTGDEDGRETVARVAAMRREFGRRAELAEELELACQVAKAGRTLSWDRALRMRGAEEAGEFADAPLHALRSLLSDSWIAAV
jgi:hypothetical protein